MTICPHTGVSQPECSCRVCLQAQIEQHMPSLLMSGRPQPAADGRELADRARARTRFARVAAAIRPRSARRDRAA